MTRWRPADDPGPAEGLRAPEVVVVGSASRDLVRDDPRGWRLGGGVSYAALDERQAGRQDRSRDRPRSPGMGCARAGPARSGRRRAAPCPAAARAGLPERRGGRAAQPDLPGPWRPVDAARPAARLGGRGRLDPGPGRRGAARRLVRGDRWRRLHGARLAGVAAHAAGRRTREAAAARSGPRWSPGPTWLRSASTTSRPAPGRRISPRT